MDSVREKNYFSQYKLNSLVVRVPGEVLGQAPSSSRPSPRTSPVASQLLSLQNQNFVLPLNLDMHLDLGRKDAWQTKDASKSTFFSR
jgi:hypothetical protein